MTATIPNLDGASRVYAVFGDPVAQVQTPHLINPLFAAHGENVFAVPFHVTPAQFPDAWSVFSRLSNVAGIGVTVPHKVAAARLCDRLTPAAREVGAVNSIQRASDGTMEGALFDGLGFVAGLGDARQQLQSASVLLVGAGGAGRAIAHALAEEPIAALSVLDLDETAVRFTVDMVNRHAGRDLASAGQPALEGHTVLINATPIGLRSAEPFPVDLTALSPSVLVADIASLAQETALLRLARERGCLTSDGSDMLKAQITLIAGFAAGRPAGTPIGG